MMPQQVISVPRNRRVVKRARRRTLVFALMWLVVFIGLGHVALFAFGDIGPDSMWAFLVYLLLEFALLTILPHPGEPKKK